MNITEDNKQKIKTALFIGAVAILVLILITLVALILFRPTPPANSDKPGANEGQSTQKQEETPLLAPNPFGPEDFVMDNGYLTCIADTAILGIDVSGYQGEIDWQKVKQAGVEFAIIRVAGRGYGKKGVMYPDDYAQKNYDGAKKAGIQVGAYFFSQAITPEEAIEEADYILELTKDWVLEFPIVYDWEYISEDARTGNVDAQTLTACTEAFCRTVEKAGREAMVYFNPHQNKKAFNLDKLADYDFWLAMYTDKMTYPFKVDMWQYSATGKVPGINGNVDMNLYFPYDNE